MGRNSYFQQNSFKLNKDTLPFTSGKLLVGAKNGKEKTGSNALGSVFI